MLEGKVANPINNENIVFRQDIFVCEHRLEDVDNPGRSSSALLNDTVRARFKPEPDHSLLLVGPFAGLFWVEALGCWDIKAFYE